MNDRAGLTQDSSNRKMDQRRSQRTLLVMPLAISWTTNTGMRVREHAETEVVSASGALLRMKTKISTTGRVDVKRPATNQSAAVKVVTVSNPGPDGWIRIGVEFLTPNTSFWGINFPPVDMAPVEEMPPAKPTLASLMAARVNNAMNRAPSATVPPAAPARFPMALMPQGGK
jgi:hypothetical protein